MYDEFDRTKRPALMQAAKERVSELRGAADDAPAPRRPGPIAGRTAAPAWLVPALVLGTAAALYLLFMSAAPPAPLAVEPAPTAPYAEQGAAPALAPPLPTTEPVAPPTAAPAGIGTGEGYIEPVAPAQAAPAAPAVPPAVVTDLIPEPTAVPAGWHPPLVEGQPAPTPNNFVERREP